MGQEQPPDVSLMERVKRLEQVVEKMVGKFLPHALVDRVDGVQAVPQELVPNAFGEQIGPVPVPQNKEEVSERTQHAHFGREPFDNDGHHYFDCDDPEGLASAVDLRRSTRPPSMSRFSQTQYTDKVAAVLTATQRQVPATKHVETPQVQHIDEFVAVLTVIQRQGPQFQTVLKTVEAPLAQFIGKVDMLMIRQRRSFTQKRLPGACRTV